MWPGQLTGGGARNNLSKEPKRGSATAFESGKGRQMSHLRFTGFSAELFRFLAALSRNNDRQWFAEHRRDYQNHVLSPIKSFTLDLGPSIRLVNEEFETSPRVGHTITRINNDSRFQKSRSP